MELSIVSLYGENLIEYNNTEAQIQEPHPDVNLPCTRGNWGDLVNSLGIVKMKFIRCDKIPSYTENSKILSNIVTTTPKFHIIFDFTCAPIDLSLIQCVGSMLVSHTVIYETVEKSIDFNLMNTPIRNFNLNAQEFKKAAYKTKAKEFEHWPLGAKGLQDLIEFSWKKVCDVAELVPKNHNMLYLRFHTTLRHNHWYEEIETPENCSICLEKYSEVRYPVKYLPCSHVFHHHCINKWLEKCSSENRHCPLCRSRIG